MTREQKIEEAARALVNSERPAFLGTSPLAASIRMVGSDKIDALRAALSTPADAPAPAEQEAGRCTALDHPPRCNQPPVPGTNTCWAHGGDLISKTAPPPRPDEEDKP